MQYLKQFLAFLFSRQMLAFLAMVVLALAIWFVGPLLAVDGLRPLASVGVRVTFIVLLLVLGIFWLVSGPYSLVGVTALCLLLWHAGPLLAVGAARPWHHCGYAHRSSLPSSCCMRFTGSTGCGMPFATTTICSPGS